MDLFGIFRRKNKAKRSRRVQSYRGFDSAKADRLFANWSTSGSSIDTSLFEGLSALRARSRDQFLNNDYARRYAELVKSNVVGPRGVLLQAASQNDSGNMDTLANGAIEAAWAEWGRAENCDLEGVSSWLQKQWQAIVSGAIDGEILVRKYVGKGYGNFYFQIQHIDPALLDERLNQPLTGGGFIRMGIEYDARKRPVAYWLLNRLFGEHSLAGRKYDRVPASQIIHAFEPAQVGQSRGYPWLSTSLGSMKMLDAYFEAAVTAARAGAAKMGFLQTPDGAEYTGDEIASDGSVISDFEAGIIEQLPEGVTFSGFDPKYPHEQFDSFTKTFIRRMAISGGVAYHAISGDLEGVNFSSIRAGVLEERENWKSRQEWFIEWYCRPIFEAWLETALTAGIIKVFDRPLKSYLFDKYRRVRWQARRWSWVDPQKDVNSNKIQVDENFSTVSQVIRDTGRDPDEVFEERAKEKAKMKELGLTEAEVMASGS